MNELILKEKLNDYLRREMRSKGGQTEVATRSGISYSSLRTSLSKNTYFEGDLRRLLQTLGVSIESIASLNERFDFKLAQPRRGPRRLESRKSANLLEAFSLFDQRLRKITGVLSDTANDVNRLFESMGKGDLMILLFADEMPLEWTGASGSWLRSCVQRMLERGAQIVYLFPSDRLVAELLNECPGVPFRSSSAVMSVFDRFKNSLDEPLGTQSVDLDSGSSLFCIEYDASSFCTPGHKYALFCHGENQFERIWATANFPIKTSILNETFGSPQRLIMEVSPEIRDSLYETCSTILTAAAAKNPGLDAIVARLQNVGC